MQKTLETKYPCTDEVCEVFLEESMEKQIKIASAIE